MRHPPASLLHFVELGQFYRLQLLQDAKGQKFFAHTRWGRVGEFGQVKTMGPFDLDPALKEFDKKFKDKSGHKWVDRSEPAKKGKYTFIERNYEDDDDNDGCETKTEVKEEDDDRPGVESKLPVQTQRLVELIFNQNHFNAALEAIGYNANKLPLGKLSKATLKQGFEHLHELASLIKHPNLAGNKYNTTQEEVSLAKAQIFLTLTKNEMARLSKIFPTNTTPRFLTNLAAIVPQQSTPTTVSVPKSPCWTPSPTWKSPIPS